MRPATTDRTRRQVVAGAAVALAITGVGSVGYALASQVGPPPPVNNSMQHHDMGSMGPAPAAPSTTGSPSAQRRQGARYDQPVGPVMKASAPVRVRIPSLQVSATTLDLGLQKDRRMEVPGDGTHVGWFTGSPSPGELGPSILAAHVTWHSKPAVFFDLGDLRSGQRIVVDRADGSTATFTVTGVGQYRKAKFPTQKVYGSVNRAALRLITCGGVFDGETGHHVDNVVVYAQLTSTS